MPVSLLPLIVPLLLIGIPLLFLMKGQKASLIAASVSASLIIIFFLSVYAPGWALAAKANAGDAKAQYELARWTERHCEQISEFILWPCEADVLGGYEWLEKSAGRDYPRPYML